MSVRPEIFLLIVGCMLLTALPRVLPMLLADRVALPRWFLLWLRHIPVAVISALFFPEVLLHNGGWRDWNDPYLLAAFPTLLAAFVSRSIVFTIVFGTLLFSALKYFL